MPPFDLQPDSDADGTPPPARQGYTATGVFFVAWIGLVLTLGAVLLPQPFDLLRYYGAAMAGGAALATVFWGAAWLAGLRRKSLIGNAGACAGLILIALLTVDFTHDVARRRLGGDLAAMNSIRVGLDGVPVFAPGTTPGPIAREALSFFAYSAQQGRASADIFRRNGYYQNDPVLLARDPSPLADCGRAERSAPALDAIDDAWFARLDRFRAYLSTAIGDATWRAQALGQLAGYGPAPGQRATWRRLRHELLGSTDAYCRLLARRNWRLTNSNWRFTDPGDQAEFIRLRDATARAYAAQVALVPAYNYAMATPAIRPTPAAR